MYLVFRSWKCLVLQRLIINPITIYSSYHQGFLTHASQRRAFPSPRPKATTFVWVATEVTKERRVVGT